MIGGPRSASRWGLLLRIEEDSDAGGVAVVDVLDGVADVIVWGKAGISWVGGGAPEYGGASKSPPNSMSWSLMSCSMSEGAKKTEM